MTSVIKIRQAQRAGARLVIGFAGISGSGKTRTAIEFAYGLAGYDASKVGFIDTENRRGSLYADVLKKHPTHPTDAPFWIGDLEPPFTPERYSEAILEFQRAGVEVLVIDSVTHEYEGTGGILEIREPVPPSKAKRDNIAKERHKKFMNVLLQSNMHIVPCIRAREKVVVEQREGKTVYIPQGIQPVQEKNFMFEMTASLLMFDAGKLQELIKMPDELAAMLGRGKGYITSADGKAVRDWVDGGGKLDPEIELARSTLKTTSEKGLAALEAAFTSMSAKVKRALKGDGTIDVLKTAATAYDAKRVDSQAGGAALANLNDEIDAG